MSDRLTQLQDAVNQARNRCVLHISVKKFFCYLGLNIGFPNKFSYI